MKSKIVITSLVLVLSFSGQAQTQQLSLKDALELAVTGNRNLQISQIENKKADEAIGEYRTYLKPSVNLTTSYSLYAERPVIFLRDEGSSKRVNDVKVGGTNALYTGVTASYPLVQPVIRENIKLATINSQLQRQKTEDLVNNLLFNVAETYLTIQFYREQVLLFHQSLQRNERALADSRLFFMQGKGLKTDTLRNYIDVQNLKASISELKNQIGIQFLHLKQLIGVGEDADIELTDPLFSLVANNNGQNADSLKAIAWTNRPDIKMQELNIDYSKAALNAVQSEFKPNVQLLAQYQLQAQSDKFSFWNYNVPRTSFVGIQLNVPIYSGKRVKYKTAQATYSIKQHEIAMDELKQSVSKELKLLSAGLEEAYHQKQIQEKNLEAAQTNYSMMNDRFKYGLSNRLELTDAELSLTKARIQHLQAIYVIRLTELQLDKALGRLKIKRDN